MPESADLLNQRKYIFKQARYLSALYCTKIKIHITMDIFTVMCLQDGKQIHLLNVDMKIRYIIYSPFSLDDHVVAYPISVQEIGLSPDIIPKYWTLIFNREYFLGVNATAM